MIDFPHLTVVPGEAISASKWNSLIGHLTAMQRSIESGSFRSPTSKPTLPTPLGGSGSLAGVFCIIREIEDDADLAVQIEFAQRGHNFAEAGIPEDYGRYVGGHELMRTSAVPPDPIPPFSEYLNAATVYPHTVGVDLRYALWPHSEDPGDPLYRDTHVEDTDIMLAMEIEDDWVVFPIFRLFAGVVSDTARQFDCNVEM